MILGGLEIPTWALLSVAVLILFYLYSTKNHGVFKKAGIPGPKPVPLFGNMMDLYGQSIMDIDMAYYKKYGRFVGTFQGMLPTLLVSDAEWLKEAFIKNFTLTLDRNPLFGGGAMDYGLFNLGSEHWKYVRTMLSPTFTQGKLKKMLPAISKCEDTFIQALKEEADKPVDIRTRLNALTLDVIANTAFGIEIDTQTNPNSQFLKHALALVGEFENPKGFFGPLTLFFKFMLLMFANKPVLNFVERTFGFSTLDYKANKYFESLCEQVIKQRSEAGEGHDFVQSLVGKIVEVDKKDPDALFDEQGNIWTRKGLLKQEVLGNATLFLFAGFQTTADSMLFAFYEMAHNQDKQQKAYEEIMSVCDMEEITVEQLGKLQYIDCCLSETMRLYPQGFRFDRIAAKDFTLKGVSVKKGTAITACGFVCHRDPEVWHDPEEFIPERFLPDNMPDGVPSAYMPFGIGNRSCIGNRLALLEMKMTVARTLKLFKIERCPETPSRPIAFQPTLAVAPKSTIYVKITPRS